MSDVPSIPGYHIRARIGGGGFGDVYEAEQSATGARVAIKVLRGTDEKLRAALENEFRILSTLRHANVAAVRDYGIAGGRAYMVSDWAEGAPLARAQLSKDGGAIDERSLLAAIHQAASALAYIHGRRVVHGDLKPANLLTWRDADGLRVTLIDFGLGKTRGGQSSGLSGTFEYMAPEVIRGAPAGPSADLYALGCILYEIVSGAPPFSGGAPADVLRQHLSIRAPSLKGMADVSTRIVAWIESLIEKEPLLRIPTAARLAALTAAELGLPAVPEEDTDVPELRLPDVPLETEMAKALEGYETSRRTASGLSIEGPRGIGKSRFMARLRTELQLRGARVSEIAGRPGAADFEPVLSVVGPAFAGTDAADPLALHAAVLASRFPHAFPGVAPAAPSGLDAEGEKLRIFFAAAELLDGSIGPEAILADDYHLLDPLSSEFLLYYHDYLRANSRARMFLVIASDPGSGSADAAEFRSAEGVAALTLPAFSFQQSGESLRALFGAAASPSFLSVLHRQSAGVPGRIEELLRFCRTEGILESGPGGWVIHERDNLGEVFPASIEEDARARFRSLLPIERTLIEVLSASPVPVPLAMLVELAAADFGDAYAACDRLAARDFTAWVGDALEPPHPAVARALDVPADRLTELHDRYSAWYGKQSDGAAADTTIAHHLLLGSNPSEALPVLRRAAAAKERAFDYAASERLLSDALPLAAGSDREDERYGILRSLSDLCNVLGKRDAEFDHVQEMFLLAGKSGRPDRVADVYKRQAEFYMSTAEFDRARKSAEKALASYAEAGNRLGVAACRHTIGYSEYRTRPGEAVVSSYLAAREIYEAEGAALDEGNVLVDIGVVYTSILNSPERALEYFEQALRRFEAAGFDRGRARAIGNIGFQHYYLGDYERSLERHTEANGLFRSIGDRRAIAISLNGMAQCELALSRYSDAAAHLDEGGRISREVRDDNNLEAIEENLGELSITLGQYDRAIDHYENARNIAERLGKQVGIVANEIDIAGAYIEKRDGDAAQKSLRKARSLLDGVQDLNVEAMLYYRSGMLHLTKGKLQDFDKALEHFRALGELADTHGFRSQQILARSYAGLAHMHLGRHKEALELSRQAVALLEENTHLYGGTQDILYNHARILRANKRPAESIAALDEAYQALMRNAAAVTDAQLYRSYTELVHVNADIIREHALQRRGDSKEALAAVRDQNLRTLYAVTRDIASVLDLPLLLDTIMDSALTALNGERGLIFLLEDEQLVLKVSRGVEQETIRDATEISLSILRDVMRGGGPIIVSDTSKDDAFKRRESVVNYHIHSLICAPMKSKDRIVGTVYVDSRGDAVSSMTFSEIDAEFLEAFANLASIAIENARLHARLREENVYLREQVERQFGFENIVGDSAVMKKLFSETQAAVQSEAGVLIYGESGTGKELIARAIHFNGARRNGRFVAVDCGALPDTLLESELFGYKRGAFTGAYADKPGLFEEANHGTLFLDEIANTSLPFQARLLRILQEGEYRRVGDTLTRTTDVRIVCATNKILQEEIRAERFRQDLFYRLNVIPITVPPLRERSGDIPLLVQHFIVRFNEKNHTACRGASEDLLEFLKTLPWPGNVRELENLVNRMASLASEDVLTTRDLPADYLAATETAAGADRQFTVSFKPPRRLMTMQDMEREHIQYVLQHTGGNKSEAAKVLGLKRTTLVERMKKLGMM